MESLFLSELPEHLLSTSPSSPGLFAPERPSAAAQGIYSFFGRAPRNPRGAARGEEPPDPFERRAGPRRRRCRLRPRPGARRPRRPLPRAHGGAATPRTCPGARSSAAAASATRRSARAWCWSSRAQGEDAKLTVFFEKAGKRKLVARFANLELL